MSRITQMDYLVNNSFSLHHTNIPIDFLLKIPDLMLHREANLYATHFPICYIVWTQEGMNRPHIIQIVCIIDKK